MLQIERTTPQPLYRQISQWIRQRISSGAWPEYYKLKAEIDLAAELGVNRGTVRKAISELIAEGQLVRIHGRGTFVASHTLDQPLAERLIATSEDLLERGIAFETRVLSQAVVHPEPRVASLLTLAPGAQVLALERIRLVGHTPLILLHNYVACEKCPGVERVDFTQQRLLDTLERQFKLALDWGRRAFQAQPATEAIAGLLAIQPGDPVMYLEQLVYLRDGSPVELSDVWLRGDRFRLTSFLKRNPPASHAGATHELFSHGEQGGPLG